STLAHDALVTFRLTVLAQLTPGHEEEPQGTQELDDHEQCQTENALPIKGTGLELSLFQAEQQRNGRDEIRSEQRRPAGKESGKHRQRIDKHAQSAKLGEEVEAAVDNSFNHRAADRRGVKT